MIETRLMDPDTRVEILEAGHPGEMEIRGPTVFDGYFKAPQISALSFTADGYFQTGDLFEIGGSGEDARYYRFVGRLKQLIIRGGMKVAPEELEGLLATHPDVLEASAIGYRDEILGERICAIVVPRKKGALISLESMQDHLRNAGLARFKWPERIRHLEALPRNAVGKVVRSDLMPIAARPD
jgi:non-ribosomal peptide synthetase component E (peptide arylation enzyme)